MVLLKHALIVLIIDLLGPLSAFAGGASTTIRATATVAPALGLFVGTDIPCFSGAESRETGNLAIIGPAGGTIFLTISDERRTLTEYSLLPGTGSGNQVVGLIAVEPELYQDVASQIDISGNAPSLQKKLIITLIYTEN